MRLHQWIIGALLVVACAGSASGDAPRQISHQGVLTDSSGVAVRDGLYTIDFDILDAPVPGNVLFHQQVQVNVIGGVYNVLLSDSGTSQNLKDTFENYSNTYLRLTIQAGPDVSAPQELSPSQKLASVPYALSAPSSGGVVIATDSDTPGRTEITGGTGATAEVSTVKPTLEVPEVSAGTIVVDAGVTLTSTLVNTDGRVALRYKVGSTTTICRQIEFQFPSFQTLNLPIRCVIANATPGTAYEFNLFITKTQGTLYYGDANNTSQHDSTIYIDAIWYPPR